jgi:PAS domain S-box-containing protein
LLPSGRFFRIALAIEVALVGLLVLGVSGIVTSASSRLFSDSVQSAVALSTTTCVFLAGKRSRGHLRRLWLLFAAAIFLVFLAQALVTYFANFSHRSAVTPWPSDIIFILWVLPIMLMLLPQMVEESGGLDWLTVLDFVQVGIVAVTAYIYFYYFASVWQTEGHQMVLRIMRLQGYRDAAIVAIFFAASRRATLSVKAFYRRVSAFFLLDAGPALFYTLFWKATRANGGWSDVAWCVPFVFLTAIAGTWNQAASASTKEPVPPFRNTILSQALPICIPLLVLFMGRQIAHAQTITAWVAITLAFCTSTTRLVLTNEKQRRISDDLRKTETALLQSSEMFAAAFHSSPDAIIISLMPEGRYLTVNESFLRLTGYEREEILGKSAAQLKIWENDEDRARVLALLRTAAEIKEEEILIRTKCGQIRNVQLSAARVQLVDGSGVLGMLRDVTDRRRAEEALRVSEERFRTLVQDMHVGIVLLGPQAETTYANAAALEIFGLHSDQVRGKSTSNFQMTAVHEDGAEMPFQERPGPQAIATKQPVYNKVVGWRSNRGDHAIWTLVDAVPQLTEQGEVANVVLSISNITELKRAEKALQTSEELFRTLVESMSICVILLDPEARVLFANQATLQLLGIPLESLLGKTSQELGIVALRGDGTEIPFELRPGPQTIATGKPIRAQVIGWRHHQTSEIIWTTGEVVPIFNEDGKLAKLVATLSNITKLKEAEEAMHQLSARLLRLQDEERRRLGRELHDSLAQSVMAVSLDLSMIARSSLPLDKPSKQSLSRARGTLQEMSREIRTLSYLLHPPVLDELGLVSAIEEYAIGFSERSGIALELDVQPGFSRISQDAETALFRIVQESLANIQRHSGSLTGMIRLRSMPGRIQLEVSDAGHGIANDSYRVEGSAKGKAARLGVGILGMRERMAQLGGSLEVLSSSSGTTVKATIPIILGTTDASPSHSRS